MYTHLRGMQAATAANLVFDRRMALFLMEWARNHPHCSPGGEALYVQPEATLSSYFAQTDRAFMRLLAVPFIAAHLARPDTDVFFDPLTGDPLFSHAEQQLYNLSRRLCAEEIHIPFRSIHPHKQTPCGGNADIATYPPESEVRYNSGNHFASRPSNTIVFDENAQRVQNLAEGRLTILYKRGYLEERLQEVKVLTAAMQSAGVTGMQFFVICSRHSVKEGHFGTSLVVMDTARPDFPHRVLVCDTLQKKLPDHPRWWYHFITGFSGVFGEGVAEIIEDLSHPLQKVNVKGDDPYRHDWDCPYYAASLAEALAMLVKQAPALIEAGDSAEIYTAMQAFMPDYYHPCGELKSRDEIRYANRLKRWNSGRHTLERLINSTTEKSSRALDAE